MKDSRFPQKEVLQTKKELFDRTINFSLTYLKPENRLNGATFDAILHGIAKNIDTLEKLISQSKQVMVTRKYKKLLKEQAFSTETLSEGLYQKQKVLEPSVSIMMGHLPCVKLE